MLTRPDGTTITSADIWQARRRASWATCSPSAKEKGTPCCARKNDEKRFINGTCAFCGLPREKHS